MRSRRIVLELPEEMFGDLERVADALGIKDPSEAAIIGLARWISQRTAELGDRDPAQKYFVNEALDELNRKK